MNTTAEDCRKQAAELRAKDTIGNLSLIHVLERAAREIEHLEDLVKSYKHMLRG